MNPEMTFDKAIDNAAALIKLGQTRVHLFGNQEFPWHIAESCNAGCSFRYSMPVSAEFTGRRDGLTFVWSFNLEERDANGKSGARIDIQACKKVLAKLKGPALVEFREYLSSSSVAVRKQGDEYQEIADRLYKDAAVLRDLVKA